MTDSPFRGAFGHQHGDPRGLLERIHAQLRERIQEAAEMAGLELMVELRRRHGKPAPDTASTEDRKEFEDTVRGLLEHLSAAFRSGVSSDLRAALDRVTPGEESSRLVAEQALLARELPDYWQRFETYRAGHARARLEAPPPERGWLGRLFNG